MTENFNTGWRFHAEEANMRPFVRHCWKNGEARAYAAEKYNDNDWQDVTLPHDWCYALDFDPDYNLSHGHYKLNLSDSVCSDPLVVPVDRGTPIGWYRKRFTLPAEQAEKLCYIHFEGIFRDCEIYVNGTYIGRHMSGYTGMRFRIDDALYFGGRENVIAVRVDCTQVEGWFYEGAGIYRNAYLEILDPVSIARDTLFVRPEPEWENGTAVRGTASVSCVLRNETDTDATVRVTFTMEGQTVTAHALVPAYGTVAVSDSITITRPRLWELDDPQLYTLTAAADCGVFHDEVQTECGFRTIRFDPDHGFFLNERRVQINGVCLHQDFACVGAALPYELHAYKIRRLREMGCNAIRTAHNAPAPELLEVCDRLGMLVMDETRHFGSSEEALDEMTSIVRRDRNHPSVILWSIGNEEHTRQNTDNGRRMARAMIRAIRQWDTTRPITYGGNNGGQYAGINETVDVRGFNYLHINWHDYLEKYHADHPHQPLVGSEEASALYNRGESVTDFAAHTVAGYDEYVAPWGSTAEGWVKYCDAHPYIAGAFLWTGFDYSGEPSPYMQNTVTSFGVIDLCGWAKDVYYYYKSWWRKEDTLYLFPDWNHHTVREPVRVVVYTNLPEVELFVNGVSFGRKNVERLSHLEWEVPYEPGKIEAVGYRDGREVQRFARVTHGTPAKIRLERAERPGRSGTALVTARLLDANGNPVENGVRTKIMWQVTGGEMLGVGNGDPKSMEKNQFAPVPVVRTLDGWEKREGDAWIPYDPNGAPDPAIFTYPMETAAHPETVIETFRDCGRIVFSRPQKAETATELRCVFPDEGGEALLTFGRIEGKFRIVLNGETIADRDKNGFPQSFRVWLKAGENTLAVRLTAWDHLEGLKNGVRLTREQKAEWFRYDYHGLAMAAIRCTSDDTVVTVAADGLAGDTLTIARNG